VKNQILTCELLEKINWITEDQLRSAVRRGHLHPKRLPNGLFIWPPKAVLEAEQYFAWRAKEGVGSNRRYRQPGGRCGEARGSKSYSGVKKVKHER